MKVKNVSQDIADMGITMVWLPPPTDSLSKEGYMPRELDKLDSAYGSAGDLKDLLKTLRAAGLHPIADTVLNHRCASFQGTTKKTLATTECSKGV